jgi:hypothetical protein
MNIPYVRRSRFLNDCENAIRRGGAAEVELVQFMLDKGGYAGHITVTIPDGDSGSFGTDWKASDPTRFPARIKAAATALFNCGCRGRYEVIHKNGTLEIRRRAL